MNLRVIQGLVWRYIYIYRRSLPRLIETVFWPVMDLLVWGFLTVYLNTLTSSVAGTVTYLIGAMIFWDVLYRSAQGVAVSFLEDIWARNTLNVFVAPVRLREFVAATYIVGFIKTSLIVAILAGLAWVVYEFNLGTMGFSLIPLFINLLVMGWSIGMFTTAIIMRYGQSVEALAWGVPFLIQPFAAVFYPLHVLPGWMQFIGNGLPATHVFEGMRAVLQGGPFPTQQLIYASLLNLVWLLAMSLFLGQMFAAARKHGYLAKLGTQ